MSGKCTAKPQRLCFALMCIWVDCAGAFLAVIEYVLGSFLVFSPGCDNLYLVSSGPALFIGMTAHLWVLLMTVGVVIGAAAALVCTLFGLRCERVGQDHRIWF